MEVAYLGFFDTIANWIFGKILSPVFSFISNLLSTVFSWLFENVLAPVLMPVLQEAISFFLDLWMTLASTQFYLLLTAFLKVIDYLQTAFDTFIGLRDVSYVSQSGTITGPLLEVLFQQPTISTLFWALTLGGLSIALLLTIIATAKSSFDLDFENKRPVSRVLTSFFKTFISLFTIPFFTYFILKIATVILRGISSAMGGSEEYSLSRMIFTIVTMNAAKNDAYNLSSDNSVLGGVLGTTPVDAARYPFYIGEKNYWQMSQVTDVFNLADFDFLIGFIISIFILFTLAICLIIFIQRIFEVLLLYIVSPYFVAMMPLDDGEKFARWRELFVGKCFTGFGSVIAMRLYLLLTPAIMSNTIQFELGSSQEAAYFLKLFFMAGGAWAVYKMGPMVTSILSSQAGQTESTTGNMIGGALFGATAGALIGRGRQALVGAAGNAGRKAGSGGGEEGTLGENPAEPQAFRGGIRSGSAASAIGKGPGSLSAAAGRRGDAIGRQRIGQGSSVVRSFKAPFGTYQKQTGAAGEQQKKILGGLYQSSNTRAGGKSRSIFNGLYSSDKTGERRTERNVGFGLYSRHTDVSDGKTTKSFGGGLIKREYDSQGKAVGMHLSSSLSIGRGEDGHWHCTSLAIPGLAKMKAAGPDDKLRFTSLHIPGVMRMEAAGPEGKLKITDVPVIGRHVQRNQDGKFVSQTMMGGLYRSWKDETGGKRYSFMGFENYSSGWKAHEPSAGQDRPQSTVDIGAHREDRTMKPNPNPAAGEIKESRPSGVSINIGNHRISGKGRGEDKS